MWRLAALALLLTGCAAVQAVDQYLTEIHPPPPPGHPTS
jgi:hypothetical protein